MGDPTSIGRLLIYAGLALTAIGLVVVLLARAGLRIGQLPGDLRFQTGGVTCFVPLATMILLSLVLTVIANLLLRGLNK